MGFISDILQRCLHMEQSSSTQIINKKIIPRGQEFPPWRKHLWVHYLPHYEVCNKGVHIRIRGS